MENNLYSNQPYQEPQAPKKSLLTPILIVGIIVLVFSTLFLSYFSYLKSNEIKSVEQEYAAISERLQTANNKIYQQDTVTDEITDQTEITTDSSYYSKPERESFEYINTDIGYKFMYPYVLSYDVATHSLAGSILNNDKIFIEVSTKKISDCTINCDELRELGYTQINDNPTAMYLGAKIDEENNYYDKYLTYEIQAGNKYFYISYQFENENITIEQLAVFTQIATSFEYRPDLIQDTSTSTEIMELPIAGKPVIYLYPESTQDVNVKLKYNGNLIATYPTYPNQGWNVKAFPNGKLLNYSDNKEYSYLFWEGENYWEFSDFKEGFVVSGADTATFLQTKLAKLGLTPKEYNEFIVYWLPLMQNNKYNLIHFAQEEYTDNAILDINPRPDSVLRVFMVYKELEEPITIKPQSFKDFHRKGFTVVEWGGTKL